MKVRPIALKATLMSQNQKITREIAQNAKSCSKRKDLLEIYGKLPKSCLATCGKFQGTSHQTLPKTMIKIQSNRLQTRRSKRKVKNAKNAKYR